MSILRAYQEWTKDTAVYPPKKGIEYLALGLASEAGEVASVVKRHIRDNKPLNDLYKEIGDCCWYLARLSDELGWSLEDIIEANRAKLEDRKARNAIHGQGDNR
jgi:NTP pyrophosphatase (non-canonical NTP hydrolase)